MATEIEWYITQVFQHKQQTSFHIILCVFCIHITYGFMNSLVRLSFATQV